MDERTNTRAGSPDRIRALGDLVSDQAGVASREQFYELGFTRAQLRAQCAARRWQTVGRQSFAVHTGPLTTEALHWAAVFEAGPRAQLDGASSLLAHGLTGFIPERVRVSVPRGARIRRRRTRHLDIRETRRFRSDDGQVSGVPRTRPATAAVRGALWARTDREASLLMTMSVQQGLCTPEQLGVELLRIRRDKRRRFLNDLVIDLAGGIRSLAELDGFVVDVQFSRQGRSIDVTRPEEKRVIPAQPQDTLLKRAKVCMKQK